MINKIFILLLSFYISNGFCGVSVLGTRFMLNDGMNHLNIKIVNDNESDYLIKSDLDDKDFIVSPPLFLLPKNKSNIVSVIPKEKKPHNKDKIVNLTLTAIPKSAQNNESNAISMAVRNHFKVIYRHKELSESSFEKMTLSDENNKCILSNNSDFVFTISVSKNKNDAHARIMNLSPNEKITPDNTELISNCETWINFHNEYNEIIKTIKLSNK